MLTLQGPHASQTVFTWPQPHFMDQWTRLSFGGHSIKVNISDTISNRSNIFGVWKDCKVNMSNWQVSSDLDLIFMVQWLWLSFFSNTICNRSTIFGVWQYSMIYMSVAQVLFDLDLIFKVHCSVLSLCVMVCIYIYLHDQGGWLSFLQV